PPTSTPLPYTPLFRSSPQGAGVAGELRRAGRQTGFGQWQKPGLFGGELIAVGKVAADRDLPKAMPTAAGLGFDPFDELPHRQRPDRKSTRLNSSHVKI